MKNIFTLILFFAVIFASSCKKDIISKDSTYPKLSGTYEFTYYKAWQYNLFEISSYASWDFDNTNVAGNYTCGWSYTQDGWTNALKKGIFKDLEWKVEGNILRARPSNDTGGSWTVFSFEYIDTKTIKLDGNIYVKK